MLGQGSARHIKFQGEVAARSAKSFDLSLAPGPYRFRTVEAGGEADRDIGADGVIPTLVARGSDILLEEASGRERACNSQRERQAARLRRRGPQLGQRRADGRARDRHARLPSALPRAIAASRRQCRDRLDRHHVHRPQGLDRTLRCARRRPRLQPRSRPFFVSRRIGCSAITASSSRRWAMRSWPPSPVPIMPFARRSRSRTMSQASTPPEAEARPPSC